MFHVEHCSSHEPFYEILREGARSFGVPLDDRALSRLYLYFTELRRWNAKTNLTGLTDDREITVKLFLDSLACLQAIPRNHAGPLLDIGTGAGFPGLPIKIAAPSLHVGLLEPRQKKVAFLHSIIGTLGLQGIEVHPCRLEDLTARGSSHRKYTFAITRAVNFDQIAPSVSAVMERRGKLILCRSAPFVGDIKGYGFILDKELSYDLPFGGGRRVLSVLEYTDELTH